VDGIVKTVADSSKTKDALVQEYYAKIVKKK
jgi:hypothetical protein